MTLQGLHVRVIRLPQVLLAHVGHIDDWLIGEEVQLLAAGRQRVHIVIDQRPGRISAIQVSLQRLHRLDLLGQRLIGARLAAQAVQPLLQTLQVSEDELGLDNPHIAHRVHRSLHMHHVVIVKAAHHLQDGIALANVAQELVPQPLALGGPAHEPGDVRKVHRSVNDAPALANLGELLHPRVGHRHRRLVRLDGAEGIIRRLRILRPRQRIEQRRLPNIRQTNNTNGKTHRHAPIAVVARTYASSRRPTTQIIYAISGISSERTPKTNSHR